MQFFFTSFDCFPRKGTFFLLFLLFLKSEKSKKSLKKGTIMRKTVKTSLKKKRIFLVRVPLSTSLKFER